MTGTRHHPDSDRLAARPVHTLRFGVSVLWAEQVV
jgi:hypothetical protein